MLLYPALAVASAASLLIGSNESLLASSISIPLVLATVAVAAFIILVLVDLARNRHWRAFTGAAAIFAVTHVAAAHHATAIAGESHCRSAIDASFLHLRGSPAGADVVSLCAPYRVGLTPLLKRRLTVVEAESEMETGRRRDAIATIARTAAGEPDTINLRWMLAALDNVGAYRAVVDITKSRLAKAGAAMPFRDRDTYSRILAQDLARLGQWDAAVDTIRALDATVDTSDSTMARTQHKIDAAAISNLESRTPQRLSNF